MKFIRKTLSMVVLVASTYSATAQHTVPAIVHDAQMEQQIEKLLQDMTLEEKVGQMCQLNCDVLAVKVNPLAGIKPHNYKKANLYKVLKEYGIEKDYPLTDEMPSRDVMIQIYTRVQGIEAQKGFRIDPARMDSVFTKYKVGSILNVPGTTGVSPQEWQRIIEAIQQKSMKEIGIPCLYGLDQIHGATYTVGATFFPQGINMGATFNRDLAREGARISAYETKASSVPWTFAPVTDLGRDPRWPRMWENFGEDCYLNAEMGREQVIGFQGTTPNQIGRESVAACMKHYMGYGVPVSGKDRTPSSITLQDMREKHFAPYLEMVKAGALSVMVNSAMNNGLPFHANYELLTGWLKNDLNWDGMIVTDWADIDNLWKRDHVAANRKEAIAMAINAGIDMSMDPYNWDFCPLLKQCVEEGKVDMNRIDDAVRRILRLKMRLNLFDTPTYRVEDFPLFGSKEFSGKALQAAEESMVLLKNLHQTLPLAKGKKILLTGPNANSMRTLNGGWSYSWQGEKTDDFAADYHTIYEAMQQQFGVENVNFVPGVTYKSHGLYWEENEPDYAAAIAAAQEVDYIVACVGENSYCETPGNLTDLNLSAQQKELIRQLATTGKPIILILNEGRPRLVADIEPLCQAVVNIMLPGNSGGDALARLLVGEANFSGKLPYTYPKEINSLVTYDYKPCEHLGEQMAGAYNYDAQVNVQWPFGYGLSYTQFEYSNLQVSTSSFHATDDLTFTVDVKNIGHRAGQEVVMLYSSDLVASLTPDVRRLRNFRKLALKPGEVRTVSMTIKASDLAFVGYDGKWRLEAGDFKIQVGNQVISIKCAETYVWDTANK